MGVSYKLLLVFTSVSSSETTSGLEITLRGGTNDFPRSHAPRKCKSLWLAAAFHLCLGFADNHAARQCDAEDVAHPSEATISLIEELGGDTVLHAEPDSDDEADVGQLLCCTAVDVCWPFRL